MRVASACPVTFLKYGGWTGDKNAVCSSPVTKWCPECSTGWCDTHANALNPTAPCGHWQSKLLDVERNTGLVIERREKSTEKFMIGDAVVVGEGENGEREGVVVGKDESGDNLKVERDGRAGWVSVSNVRKKV
jgi:hypothetical protein